MFNSLAAICANTNEKTSSMLFNVLNTATCKESQFGYLQVDGSVPNTYSGEANTKGVWVGGKEGLFYIILQDVLCLELD